MYFKTQRMLFALLVTFAISLLTQAMVPASAEESMPKIPVGTPLEVIGTDVGKPKLILVDKKTGMKLACTVAPTVPILLNGEAATMEDLKPTDVVHFRLDDKDSIVGIDVTRSITAIVISITGNELVLSPDYVRKDTYTILPETKFLRDGKIEQGSQCLKVGDHVEVQTHKNNVLSEVTIDCSNMFANFFNNFKKNLFKPLLLFFYLGFCVTILRLPFEFPQQIYQGLTIYLLLAIGWKGGEELAVLSGSSLMEAGTFMIVGFVANFCIGLVAYVVLRKFCHRLRPIDAATIAGYYGSDSAGTFVTCLGMLEVAAISYAAYMPVMLAVMEIPGCLVALLLAAKIRKSLKERPSYANVNPRQAVDYAHGHDSEPRSSMSSAAHGKEPRGESRSDSAVELATKSEVVTEVASKNEIPANEERFDEVETVPAKKTSILSPHMLREIFLNPGLFLLLGGIVIGFVSRLQGAGITEPDDKLFVNMFQGILCLFLLEMGMNAARRVRDLRSAGPRFVAFALIAPNVFAVFGILVACAFSHIVGHPFQLGTYVLFAVLCGSASYIAVPAVQRLAIPEASPTLPLAASLGVTFSYNVTIGIPLYLVIAELVVKTFPFS